MIYTEAEHFIKESHNEVIRQRGRLYLLKNPSVTHAGGIFLSSALPAEPEC